MISKLSSSNGTKEDFKQVRRYIYSIENFIPLTDMLALYELITNIEIAKSTIEKLSKH